jgi:hypothetical protein
MKVQWQVTRGKVAFYSRQEQNNEDIQMNPHRTRRSIGGDILSAGPSGAQTKPPGYVIIEFNVKDAESFGTYGQRAPATVT